MDLCHYCKEHHPKHEVCDAYIEKLENAKKRYRPQAGYLLGFEESDALGWYVACLNNCHNRDYWFDKANKLEKALEFYAAGQIDMGSRAVEALKENEDAE